MIREAAVAFLPARGCRGRRTNMARDADVP